MRSIYALVIVAMALGGSGVVSAQIEIDALPENTVVGDFVVGPGKIELFMRPGEERVVEVRVANRMGEPRLFYLGVEDFVGSADPTQAVVLLGAEKGPYSLRDFLFPNEWSVRVEHASQARIPVRVSIPPDAEPGGLYGSVLISTDSPPDESDATDGARGGAAIVSRIGVLFFIRVAGEVTETGELVSFATNNAKRWYSTGPVSFDIRYRNSGSIHVNPYGRITIENILGAIVGETRIDPWFVMPDTERIRGVTWNRPYLFGRYTAHLELNRGYRDIVDTASVTFWVVPVKSLLLVFGVLLGVFVLIRFLARRIEIRVK